MAPIGVCPNQMLPQERPPMGPSKGFQSVTEGATSEGYRSPILLGMTYSTPWGSDITLPLQAPQHLKGHTDSTQAYQLRGTAGLGHVAPKRNGIVTWYPSLSPTTRSGLFGCVEVHA